MTDYTQRFTSRADNYARFRPSYAPAVLDLLRRECGLTPDWVIADVGSGTGISTAMFLDHGNRVYGVEPNDAMRAYAEQTLGGNLRFTSIAARAEATTLPGASVDLVVAGQAFHWFEPDATRVEWARILRPGGWVALMWNSRQDGDSPFAQGYEALLMQYSLDYQKVHHRNVGSAALDAFFGAGQWRQATFDNPQRRDWEALSGGLQSGSYTPEPGHPNHTPLLEGMRRLFEEHQVDGYVVLPTATEVYYGQLSS
jgi:SAM-dependent methyltransferase